MTENFAANFRHISRLIVFFPVKPSRRVSRDSEDKFVRPVLKFERRRRDDDAQSTSPLMNFWTFFLREGNLRAENEFF